MRDRFLLEHGREDGGGGLTCGASAAEREGMGPARQPEKEKGEGDQRGWADSWAEAGGREGNRLREGWLGRLLRQRWLLFFVFLFHFIFPKPFSKENFECKNK